MHGMRCMALAADQAAAAHHMQMRDCATARTRPVNSRSAKQMCCSALRLLLRLCSLHSTASIPLKAAVCLQLRLLTRRAHAGTTSGPTGGRAQ